MQTETTDGSIQVREFEVIYYYVASEIYADYPSWYVSQGFSTIDKAEQHFMENMQTRYNLEEIVRKEIPVQQTHQTDVISIKTANIQT